MLMCLCIVRSLLRTAQCTIPARGSWLRVVIVGRQVQLGIMHFDACNPMQHKLKASVSYLQAKTTRKIVLRLTCNKCKTVHMHALKVRRTLPCC